MEMTNAVAAQEPARPPASSPKEVYWRYGKQAVRESERTKAERAHFEAFQEAYSLPQSTSSVSVVSDGSASDVSCHSPRGPRTERAHTTASALGGDDATRDLDHADHSQSAPSSPRSPAAFIRRMFSSGRKKESHGRALAECME